MNSRQRNRMSLLVRNLKFQTSPDRVREVFERYGSVRDVYLPLDYNTKRPRGFGFVEFHDERDAQTALEELDQGDIDGNRIQVTLAQHGRSSPDAMREREPQYRRFNRDARWRRSRSRSRSGHRNYGHRRSASWGRARDRSLSRDRRRERGGWRQYDDYKRDDRRGRDLGRNRYRNRGYEPARERRRQSRSTSRRRDGRPAPNGDKQQVSQRNYVTEESHALGNDAAAYDSGLAAPNPNGGGHETSGRHKEYVSHEDAGNESQAESRSRSPRS